MGCTAMRKALHIVFALGAALAAADVHAYCVRNALTERVHASVVASRMPVPLPAKMFSETVAAGKEFCCNPKNAECNPDRANDQSTLMFEARVEVAPTPVKCGAPDPKAQGRVVAVAPVRGFLRFEANAGFDKSKPPAGNNPPFLLKALTADNKVVTTYTCPPRG